MKILNPLDIPSKQDNEIYCFLAGSCSSNNRWRNELIKFLQGIEQQNILLLDNLTIIDPYRKDWSSLDDGEKLKEQIQWECNCLSNSDIIVTYFDKSKDDKDVYPMTLFELGKSIIGLKEKFGITKLKYRLLAYAHPDYILFDNIKCQIESLTNNWKVPLTLESTNKDLMQLGSKILESYVKISK